MQQPFFVDHSVIPTHQIGQGEGLIRAVGVCGAVGGGGGLFHSPHDLADGGAVLGQVGLAAARVGEQDLAQMAHHQRQRQQLGGFGVVVVTGISGGLVDLLGRKAPAQQAAGLLLEDGFSSYVQTLMSNNSLSSEDDLYKNYGYGDAAYGEKYLRQVYVDNLALQSVKDNADVTVEAPAETESTDGTARKQTEK